MIKFVGTKEDLCNTCNHAYKGGCPIYPPMKITKYCVEYIRRGSSPTTKK